MRAWRIPLPLLLAAVLALALPPASADSGQSALRVIKDRAYRQGVFVVVDAIVENVAPARVDAAEVSVEFYTFFDELVSAEHTVILPPALEPGQKGTLRVFTPYSDAVRKIRYRFTWRQDYAQFQNRPEEEPPSWR